MFREVNERVYELRSEDASFEILCECGSEDCTATLALDEATYEKVRTNARRFVILPGHDMAQRERVVDRRDGYFIVEKIGELGAIAERFDPRSGASR
jgi:hypothetical protein